MRKAIVLLVLSIAVCGCNKPDERPQLEPLARGLAETWQPVSHDIKLDIRPEADGNHVTLHCVLRNLSAAEIDVDQESLPWNNADAFSVGAVAADGKVIHQNPVSTPVATARISAPHAPLAIASGESIEGTIDMGLMRISDIPRDEDWLILWSYPSLKEWHSEAHYALSGITLLVANSKAAKPVATTTKLNTSLSGTSVPTLQMKQDLRDAPEILIVDNAVIHLLVFPWEDGMPMAVTRDPDTGLTSPDIRPMHIGFRLISEHGTPLPHGLRVQAIWILQDSQIWIGSEVEEAVGESNGSSRDFLVRDGPHGRSMSPVDVVLTLRDDNGAIHWLAERHQRISAVE